MSFRELLNDDVLAAAPALLGWELVKGQMRVRIVETEAYRTPDDPGCHAHRGETPRTKVMFGKPGHAYVYFTYGNHWMLNVVAHPAGVAAAILIRAARPLTGIDEMYSRRPKARRDEDLLSGPGKLCAALGITGAENGLFLLDGGALRLEPGEAVRNVVVGTRIGLAPRKGDTLPWRFCDSDQMPWVSKPWPKL